MIHQASSLNISFLAELAERISNSPFSMGDTFAPFALQLAMKQRREIGV
jgi:hypothetical protein